MAPNARGKDKGREKEVTDCGTVSLSRGEVRRNPPPPPQLKKKKTKKVSQK